MQHLHMPADIIYISIQHEHPLAIFINNITKSRLCKGKHNYINLD
jgi:hypothetical protein